MIPIHERPRLDSLTSLRFFAAALVFLRHVQPLIENTGVAWTRPFLIQGTTGVSFFFVLSGFVLMWSRRPGRTVGNFYRRRFARVWPNHAVTWLFVIAAALVAGDGLNWVVAVFNLLLLQAWVPEASVFNSVNSVSWSLSAEMFFYLCFPFIAPLVERSKRLWWLAAAACVGTLVVVAAAKVLMPTDAGQGWFVYMLPATRLFDFTLGMIAAQLLIQGKLPKIPLRYAAALAVGAYLTVGFFVTPSKIALTGYVAVTLVPFAVLVVSAAQNDVLGQSAWLRGKWLVRLGDWSFAFYLVHLLVLHYGGLIFLPDGSSLALVLAFAACSFGASVALAGLLHHAVERPAERLINRSRRNVPESIRA